jgi:hypothetical protein
MCLTGETHSSEWKACTVRVVVLVRSAVWLSWMAVPCDLNSTAIARCAFWFWCVFKVSIHVRHRARFRFKVGHCSRKRPRNTRWGLYKQLRCFIRTDTFCLPQCMSGKVVMNFELWIIMRIRGQVKETCRYWSLGCNARGLVGRDWNSVGMYCLNLRGCSSETAPQTRKETSKSSPPWEP